MPLRVFCPSGCILRMPASRAGKIVRCPNCKSVIEVHVGDKTIAETPADQPIELHARLISPEQLALIKESQKQKASQESNRQQEPIRQPAAKQTQTLREQSEQNPAKAPVLDSTPAETLSPEPTKYGNANQTKKLAEVSGVEQPSKKVPTTASHALTNERTEVGPDIDNGSKNELDSPAGDRVEFSEFSATELADSIEAAERQAEIASNPLSPESRQGILDEFSPAALREKENQRREELQQIMSVPAAVEDFKPLNIVAPPPKKKKKRRRKVKPPPVKTIEGSGSFDELEEQPISWEERMQKSNADRVVLARFFALSLLVVAAINLFPAFFYWRDWYDSIDATALPRWIYLQVFVAALHVVYAVFLFQIPDWSAMRAVSMTMLAIAFIFGLTSTGLLVGGGQGAVAGFLGISFSIVQRAAIWCVAMLCLATLMSYLGGRESANWQRAEQLLEEILAT